MDYYDKIQAAALFIKSKIDIDIKDAVILGTGLGDFVEAVEVEKEIPYSFIPHFPETTVRSHSGRFIIGRINEKPIIILAGRFHFYEGYDMKDVTLPVRVVKMLGVENIYITNVAGGINPDFEAGDMVMITDHINFLPQNPLRGSNDERLGPRFPDMKNTYSKSIQEKAQEIANELNLELKKGVYFALQGPNLETPAEYKFIHTVGADLVGMSTVPEVIVAKHSGLNIFAISIVSNVCYPLDRIQEVSVEQVIETAQKSGSKLSGLLTRLI